MDAPSPEPLIAFVVKGGVIEVHSDSRRLTCGDPAAPPTVTTIDQIEVTSNSPAFTIIIDLTGGPFAPGATPDEDGGNEIEFVFRLDASRDQPRRNGDALVVIGTAAGDALTSRWSSSLYTGGVDLNAGDGSGDWEVFFGSMEYVVIFGGGGNDRIMGSLNPLQTFFGGPGRDTLDGDSGRDVLRGQGGNDTLEGGPDADLLDGGPGKDRCDGGPGPDAEPRRCESGSA